MGEVQEYIRINRDELTVLVSEYYANGYRLAQIGCTMLGERFELNYSFDKDYKFVNLRFDVSEEEEIQSISNIYMSAFLYENEIHDLFGLKIKDIVIDYKGSFYRIKGEAPFRKKTAVKAQNNG